MENEPRHQRRKPPNKIVPALTQEQIDYFWSRVEKAGSDECWLWKASKTPGGYGEVVFWLPEEKRRVKLFAHRVACTLAHGPIPQGFDVDHVRARGCTQPSCCNPAHLETVAHAENMARGKRAVSPYCQEGHPLNEKRRCPICARANVDRYRERRLTARGRKPRPAVCKHGHKMAMYGKRDRYGDWYCRRCALDRCHKFRAARLTSSPAEPTLST